MIRLFLLACLIRLLWNLMKIRKSFKEKGNNSKKIQINSFSSKKLVLNTILKSRKLKKNNPRKQEDGDILELHMKKV